MSVGTIYTNKPYQCKSTDHVYIHDEFCYYWIVMDLQNKIWKVIKSWTARDPENVCQYQYYQKVVKTGTHDECCDFLSEKAKFRRKIILGVNENQCCLLYSHTPFECMNNSIIKYVHFRHDCTNWCGKDTIERTLKLTGIKLTGNKLKLSEPLVFNGSDDDWGITRPWEFEVKELWEIE